VPPRPLHYYRSQFAALPLYSAAMATAMSDQTSPAAASFTQLLHTAARHLQQPSDNNHNNGNNQESKGRTILMILYLCVLAMCFVTPIFYYFRLRCEETAMRRSTMAEALGLRTALEQSQQQQRQESAAVWRKYVEERRARMVQLFAPVRMVGFV
jgi:hypothetical protein